MFARVFTSLSPSVATMTPSKKTSGMTRFFFTNVLRFAVNGATEASEI